MICPCQEGTFHFIQEVTLQFKEMYKEAEVEFKTIHLGADEVPEGVWEKAPTCVEKFNKAEVSIRDDVKTYYLQRIVELGKKHDVALSFWDDIAGHHIEDDRWAGKNLSVYSWNNDWGGGNEDRAYKAANAGYSTVLVPVSNMYFDQAYSKNSDEPGFYWGSYTNTYSAFSFCQWTCSK